MSGHGIMGATLSGLDAARAILRCSNDAILSQRGAPLQVFAAEDPSTWPKRPGAKADDDLALAAGG